MTARTTTTSAFPVSIWVVAVSRAGPAALGGDDGQPEELDAGELVVLDDEAGDRLLHDADRGGDELLAVLGREG